MTSPFMHSSLWIEPWRDSVTEECGHDPRSRYAELFWLGIIGPTAAWFLRHVAHEFESSPDGFELSVAPIALQLGISPKAGPRGGMHRTLHRLVMFRLASEGHAGYAVRRRLPPLNNMQLKQLPAHLQRTHSSYCSQPMSAASGAGR